MTNHTHLICNLCGGHHTDAVTCSEAGRTAKLHSDAAKHAGEVLDLFEAEQQRILLLDPHERAMQHNYQRTMSVCYELRTFIRNMEKP